MGGGAGQRGPKGMLRYADVGGVVGRHQTAREASGRGRQLETVMWELVGAPADDRFPGGVQRVAVSEAVTCMAPNREICIATTIVERRDLTNHTTQHGQGNGLFRTAGQVERQQPASHVAEFRPSTQPSRNPFHNAVNQEARQPQPLTTLHDESTMRSLQFPFDVNNRR